MAVLILVGDDPEAEWMVSNRGFAVLLELAFEGGVAEDVREQLEVGAAMHGMLLDRDEPAARLLEHTARLVAGGERGDVEPALRAHVGALATLLRTP